VNQILSFLQATGGFLFIFGIVVLVHELGHFLAAKAVGVYAPRFSIGFGPGPAKRWGETEYRIGIIPLGGYVRMASREDEATAFLEGGSEATAEKSAEAAQTRPRNWDENAMIPFGPRPVPPDRWFESKSLLARLLILVAGVSMNALLTIAVLFGMAWYHGRTIIPTRVVGVVLSHPQTLDLTSRIFPGDTVVSVNGAAVESWTAFQDLLLMTPGDSITLQTSRGQVRVHAGPEASESRAVLAMAIRPFSPPVLDSVDPAMPAAKAGLRRGDRVLALNGAPVSSFDELSDSIRHAPGRDLNLTILRGSETTSIAVQPARVQDADLLSGQTIEIGRIGASGASGARIHEKLGVFAALGLAVEQTGSMATSIVRTLKGLVQRKISFQQLGGPIQIARESGRAAQQGFASLLLLLALLSINLAVLNLLPIPVLDGGQILIVVAEAAKGRPFSPKARQLILGTGVALVLLLMIAVSYNDILRLIRS
jgi:regulator of sigma E protease